MGDKQSSSVPLSSVKDEVLQESVKSDMEKKATKRREWDDDPFENELHESEKRARWHLERTNECPSPPSLPSLPSSLSFRERTNECPRPLRPPSLPSMPIPSSIREPNYENECAISPTEGLPECTPSSRGFYIQPSVCRAAVRQESFESDMEKECATVPMGDRSSKRKTYQLELPARVGNYRPKEASQIQSTLSQITFEEIPGTSMKKTKAEFRPIEKDLDGNSSKEIGLIEIAPQSPKSLSEQYEVDEICRSNKSGLSKDDATTSHNQSDIYYREKNRVTAIVDCDSKETMARVKELLRKMINRQPDDLEELEFRLCHLEKKHLEPFLLNEQLKSGGCKISKLSIGYTKNVTDLIPSYCQIARNYKSTKLSLVFNDLKNEDIEALLENLDENEEYEEIDMSYNRNIGPAGYENIGKIVEKHKVRVLRLADCDISDVDLHRLYVGIGDAKNDKFIELDISYNRKIEPDGYKNVGNIVKEHEVRTLRLEDCNISDKDLEYLFNGMGEAELEVLDINFTNNVTAKGFAHIGRQVAKNRVKKINLSDTQLNVETLTAFYNEVADSIEVSEGQQVLVEEIDVSYNSTMELEAYKVLGSMVKLFGVEKISLAGCGISGEHLKNLREEMKYYTEKNLHYTKMKSFNAGDNTSIEEAIVEIAMIVNECQLEELDISDCRFSANELKDFIESLGKAKLKCLYLGEKRQFDENYISEVCNLLPHIKNTLRLKGTVRNHSRSTLQKNLNILTESELEIKLDDDVTLSRTN